MSELDTLRRSLHNASHLVPPADVADRAIHGARRLRRRRRVEGVLGGGLAVVVAVALVAVVVRPAGTVTPVAPSPSAPGCPITDPVSCGVYWPTRGPRGHDQALLDRASASAVASGLVGSPYPLWGGDLPDGRTFLLFEMTHLGSGTVGQFAYVERDGHRDVAITRMHTSTNPTTFDMYVGGTPGYLVAIGPPGTAEIQFATGTRQPWATVALREGLAILPVASSSAADSAFWRFRLAGQTHWYLNNAIYQPPKGTR